MIITEENGVVRIVTSTDELVEAAAALDSGEPCEFEEAGGRRTIVFVDEEAASGAARYAELPSLQEEYDLWAARLNELVVLDGRVGRLTGVHHKANIGVELVVHCTEPHPEELPCRRTGWSLDVAMAEQ